MSETRLGDIAISQRLRDAIIKIAEKTIDRVRPADRLGTVFEVDTERQVAKILFPGNTVENLVEARFALDKVPTQAMAETFNEDGYDAPGDIVRISGLPGAYFILDFYTGGPNISPAVARTFDLSTTRIDEDLDVVRISANGKNKVTYSLVTPGSTENNIGDTWFQRDADWNIIAQWVGTGGILWTQVELSHEVIASIDAGKITVGTLDVANRLAAGAITSREISTEFLKAGFVLTGAIQVGTHTWDPVNGLIIPQPDGSRTQFSADGVTPSRLSGHALLKSASIEKDFNLNGTTNQITGKLKLANGITAPTSAPNVYQSWDSRYSNSIDNGGLGASFQAYRSMAAHPTNVNNVSVGFHYFGAGIRYINKTTGAWAGDLALGAWSDDFVMQGMGFASSHFFFYGQDYTRSSNYYIYKVDATGAKVAELYVGPYTIHNANQMTMTASTVTGGVYLAFCNNENQVRLLTWDTNLGFISDTLLYTAVAPRNIDALYVGPGDYGANKVLVASREDRMVFVWNLSGFTRQTNFDFPMALNAAIKGLHYDTTLAKFISFDPAGQVIHYTADTQARTITATYTWYDGEGTVRETTPSPVQSITLPARTLLNVETPAAPDSGVTDPTRVDKANRIGLYVGIAAAARRHQIYLGVDGSGVSIRKWTSSTISTGTALEPVTNTFGGATVPPGTIESTALDGLGAPLLELSGAGDGKMRHLTLSGNFTRPAIAGTAYTPVLSVSSGSLFSASSSGRYIIHDEGKLVTVTVTLQIVDAGTAAGAILYWTLPFSTQGGYWVFAGRDVLTTGHMVQGVTYGATNLVTTLRYDNNSMLANNRTLVLSGTYERA
jgi:hypothetical protein